MPRRRWTGPSLQAGWRTLVPLVVGGTVALILAGSLTARASDTPPPRTAAQLLGELERVDVAGYSGTVVQKSTLLDSVSGTRGLSLVRLMSGTNTIKVWYGGGVRQRIAVLDATGESDVFRNESESWQWDSNTRIAIQTTADSQDDTVADVPIPVDGTTVTPDDLARQAVAAIGPTTAVEVAAPGTIAGRRAYQLVLTPPASSSTHIGRVVLWLDATTKMPLAAQVYARGVDTDPSIDLAFTQIAFEVPDAATFQFYPPHNAVKISTFDSDGPSLASSPDPLLGLRRTVTTGSGWTRVAVISPPTDSPDSQSATTRQFGTDLTRVSGPWGSGQLLQTNHGLLTMLFVDDGRIVVGAVDPAALYAALQ